MNNCSVFRMSIGLVMTALCLHANCSNVEEFSLEKKASGSELVIIGKVVSLERDASKKTYKTAVVKVSKTLKGESLSTIRFGFDGMIGALNPECCIKGKTYLFFLIRNDENEYFSFNPPYGVYPID